ncbi:hypothetical protein EB001_17325 [bacterium]|jgi:hypothetical protein|nr:hypothetical protein [bacterium]
MKKFFVITSLLAASVLLASCNTDSVSEINVRSNGTFDVEQNMNSVCIDGKTYLMSKMGNLLLIDENRRVVPCN